LYDPASGANSLVTQIEGAGIPLTPVTAQQYAAACGTFYDATQEPYTLRHLDDPALNAALDGAAQRPLGEAWAWSRRKSSVDISPLVAVTLAHWSATETTGYAHVWNLDELAAEDEEDSDEPKRGPGGFKMLSQAETTTVRWDPANGIGT
jgi:hypothetical protein